MDQYIDSLDDAEVLYTLHTNSGYWQIKVSKTGR